MFRGYNTKKKHLRIIVQKSKSTKNISRITLVKYTVKKQQYIKQNKKKNPKI